MKRSDEEKVRGKVKDHSEVLECFVNARQPQTCCANRRHEP